MQGDLKSAKCKNRFKNIINRNAQHKHPNMGPLNKLVMQNLICWEQINGRV